MCSFVYLLAGSFIYLSIHSFRCFFIHSFVFLFIWSFIVLFWPLNRLIWHPPADKVSTCLSSDVLGTGWSRCSAADDNTDHVWLVIFIIILTPVCDQTIVNVSPGFTEASVTQIFRLSDFPVLILSLSRRLPLLFARATWHFPLSDGTHFVMRLKEGSLLFCPQTPDAPTDAHWFQKTEALQCHILFC